MVSRIKSVGLIGLDGFSAEVETEISRSDETALNVVGLPDAAIREARERIRIALANSGFPLPECVITQNLAPAHIRKEGSAYDLPMLLGILASAGKIPNPPETSAFIGEISLSGELRGTGGILASVIAAKDLGFKEIFVPYQNAAEGSVIAVEYNKADRATLEDNVAHFDLHNVRIIDHVDEESMKDCPIPSLVFLVASASTDQELKYLTSVNPKISVVIYTLDFKAAAGLPDTLAALGLTDVDTIQISVSKLGSRNTFKQEPATWIITARARE